MTVYRLQQPTVALPAEVHRLEGVEPIDLLGDGPPIAVHEQCRLVIDASHLAEDARIMFGDYEVQRYGPLLELFPFRNTIGMIGVQVETPEGLQVARSFNVHAGKTTLRRALGFLKFLKDEANDVTQLCFSTTRQSTDRTPTSIEVISRKLNAGIKTLEYFIQQHPRFHSDPVYNAQATTSTRPYSRDVEITEEGISYLAANPHAISPTRVENSHFMLHGRHYEIDHIAQRELLRNTDVYENRVIHSFLQYFAHFLEEAEAALKSRRRVNSYETYEFGASYFSFDELLERSNLVLGVHRGRIQDMRQKIIKAKQVAMNILPVSAAGVSEGFPMPTNRVLQKPHYMALYELIIEYHQAGEPEWRGANDFFGLRSLPKVYEFVCLYLVLSSFVHQMGFELEEVDYCDFMAAHESSTERPVNQPHNVYRLRRHDVAVTLYYEPILKPVQCLSRTSLPVIDAVHTHQTRNGAPSTFQPDFVLAVDRGSGSRQVHVLDAKYSNLRNVMGDSQSARRGSLAECLLKYQIGVLHRDDHGNLTPVDSTHILFSDVEVDSYTSMLHPQLRALDSYGNIPNRPLVLPTNGAVSAHPDNARVLRNLLRRIVT